MSRTTADASVEVRGVGKQYHLGAPPGTGRIYDAAARLLVRRAAPVLDSHPTMWALRDVSFHLAPGNVLGVIGRNGSGKTTLMKILARVTSPTEGEVIVKGRVGALIEVGAGFHPELTGRDNIALSGAILGMTKAEIAAARDAIIDFAEVGPLLDTAVKFYSSGMFVRLAFAVSAHLNAEVMLVDEVLAVGDAEFQEKCLRRIHELVTAGRTVLFVSHSMESVRNLCDNAIVLDAGQIVFHGPAEEAIDYYEDNVAARQGAAESERAT